MRRIGRLVVLVCALIALLTACAQTGGTDNGGAVPIGGPHPQPREETFQGCPPGGDGGDQTLNMRKNRIDDGINGTFTDVSLANLLQLSYPQDIGKVARDNWSSSDTAAVNQYEGAAIRTVGYLLAFKHEGTESTNCHALDYRDFHMWLAVNPTDSKADAMVIEVTPRINALRSGWTSSNFSSLVGQQVRISGWLLMDQEHPEQIGQTRATLWEIHPILHIEVNQSGGWTSIDS